MHMGNREEECNKLLDNILKLDGKNEKALMRKCNILLDIGKQEECKSLLSKLCEVAFQSERSQIIYTEINSLNDRIENGTKRKNLDE